MNPRLKKNNKNINRKGVASALQIAVISIAVIIVLGLFLFQAYTGLKEKMAIQSCKDSITAHSLVAKGSWGEIFTDIKCPTSEITIKDLKKTNEIIAEDMHRCWYIWNKGNGQYFQGDGTFCYVCSIYQFGDKKQEVNGLINYLGTQPIQIKYAGDVNGISYQDYLQGYSTPNSAEKVKNNPIKDITQIDVLNTSQKYATIFVYASGKDNIDKILEGGGRTTLGTTGLGAVILGTAGGTYGVGAVGAAVGSVSTAVAGGTSVAAAVAAVDFWNPIGWAVGGALLVGAGIYALDKAVTPTEPEWVSFLAFRPYNTDELNSLGCEKLDVNQMSNAGTS